MKATGVVVLFVFLVAARSAAEPAGALRALDPASVDAVALGLEASDGFRTLVAALGPARVVVHVVSGATEVFATTGTTQLAGEVGGWRYLRVVLDPRLRARERVAVLGHELQHVREILESGAATQDEVRALYERIGRPVPGTCNAFETVAAADTGARVWRELQASAALARARRDGRGGQGAGSSRDTSSATKAFHSSSLRTSNSARMR